MVVISESHFHTLASQRMLISSISEALMGGAKSSQSTSMPGGILICFSSVNEMYPHSANAGSPIMA